MRELPGVVRIRVWDPQGNLVWAVQGGQVGQHSDGQELREALAGRVAVRFTAVAPPNAAPESFTAPSVADLYVPVYSPGVNRVVGVVELAQAPLRMEAAQERWSQLAWAIAGASGILLCLILLPAAWRSQRRTRAEASSTAQRSIQKTQELQRTTEQLREALKAVKQRAEETDRMLEVTEAIGSAIEQKGLFEVIAHGAARACRVDRCSIFLRDKSGQLMVPVSSQLADRSAAARHGDGAESLRALALEEMPPFLLEAVRRQEPVVISDPGSDRRNAHRSARSAGVYARSAGPPTRQLVCRLIGSLSRISPRSTVGPKRWVSAMNMSALHKHSRHGADGPRPGTIELYRRG